MTHRLSFFFRPVFFLLLALGAASAARAQFEISGITFTRLYQAGAPSQLNPPTTTPQYAGAFVSAGGSAARDVSATITVRYPSGGAIALKASSFGSMFASGVPRYLTGEIITPPATQADKASIADATYWRQAPVAIGESFAEPFTLNTVTVDVGGSGYTTVPTVGFTGGGGTGAAATATVALGRVVSVTFSNRGSGYTSVPGVTFSGGGGTGATATTVAAPSTVTPLPLTLDAVTVLEGGAGYTTVPTVVFSGGGGTGAAATAGKLGAIAEFSPSRCGGFTAYLLSVGVSPEFSPRSASRGASATSR